MDHYNEINKSQSLLLNDKHRLDDSKVYGEQIIPSESGLQDKSIGINTVMGNDNNLDLLNKVLALLENYVSLIKAFRQAHELTGSGGDILLYVGLCREVTELIACHSQLISVLNQHITIIKNICNETYKQLRSERKINHPWIAQYFFAKKYMEQAQINLTSVLSSLYDISSSMSEVQAQDYADKVAEKINVFKANVHSILLRTHQLTNNEKPMLEEEKSQSLHLTIASNQPQILPKINNISVESEYDVLLNGEKIYLNSINPEKEKRRMIN